MTYRNPRRAQRALGNRQKRRRTDYRENVSTLNRIRLGTLPPEPTTDVCDGCKMAASTFGTRRAFREHRRGCGE